MEGNGTKLKVSHSYALLRTVPRLNPANAGSPPRPRMSNEANQGHTRSKRGRPGPAVTSDRRAK